MKGLRKVARAAVSNRSGTSHFDPSGNPAMGCLADGGPLAVDTVALDELVREGAVPRPDLMKIDVEGGALRVLQGGRHCLEEARPAIILSAHGWRLFDDCQQLLRSIGYEQEVEKDGSEDGDYLVIARSRTV